VVDYMQSLGWDPISPNKKLGMGAQACQPK
jgi:hypothetical protein